MTRNKILDKFLDMWHNIKEKQIWQNHKICITAIAVVIVAAIIL